MANWPATCSYTPAFSHSAHLERNKKRLSRRSLPVGAEGPGTAGPPGTREVQGSAHRSHGSWFQSVHSSSSSSSSAGFGSRAQTSREGNVICSSNLFAPLVFLALGAGAGRGGPPSKWVLQLQLGRICSLRTHREHSFSRPCGRAPRCAGEETLTATRLPSVFQP